MNILGLYGGFGFDPYENPQFNYIHESGATIIKDGLHIASISEERLSKLKYDGRVPSLSTEYCLDAANLNVEDIDVIYVGDCGCGGFYNNWSSSVENLKNIFINAEIQLINHHICHASASIFSCNYNEGTFITLDGSGSAIIDQKKMVGHEQSTIGYFNKEKGIFRIFQSLPWNNTFGMYYLKWAHTIFCEKVDKKIDFYDPKYRNTFCGKIMGLSAYGKSQLDIEDYVVDNLSTPLVQMKFIESKEFNNLGVDDKAYFIQNSFEKSLLSYLKKMKEDGYLEDNLCLSGGVFLNILANTEIEKEGIANNVHIPPFPSDCGLHFGAACYAAFKNNEVITLPKNLATLGIEYSDEDIKSVLDKNDIEYKRYDSFENLCNEVSKDLRDNKIIGWFQNRSEFGPRALGSRSLFMNAQPKENKDLINSKVKHREYWRPFAGIILEDYVEEYFEEGFKSPYMLYSQTIKKEKINSIGAICHEDNTCRIQTVNNDLHPQVNSLLKEYYKLTGSPVVLNTSFNDNGQPIVETPEDAIETFLKLQVDTLAIGNYIVKKINQ